MRYSRYVVLQGIIAGIVFLVFATVFLSVAGPGVGGLVALLAVFVALGFGLTVAWGTGRWRTTADLPFPAYWESWA